MSASNTFGVTASDIAEGIKAWDEFTASTDPTLATVNGWINAYAGRLCTLLRSHVASGNPADITEAAAPDLYFSCRQAVIDRVVARVLRQLDETDNPSVIAGEEQYAELHDELKKAPAIVLSEVGTGMVATSHGSDPTLPANTYQGAARINPTWWGN